MEHIVSVDPCKFAIVLLDPPFHDTILPSPDVFCLKLVPYHLNHVLIHKFVPTSQPIIYCKE